MGLLKDAKRLDDTVLGRSDSTRGFVINALYGMHPALAPVWLVVGIACLVLAPVALLADRPDSAVFALVAGLGSLFMAYVCKGMPRRPRD